jgi:hypothetical protein
MSEIEIPVEYASKYKEIHLKIKKIARCSSNSCSYSRSWRRRIS